jgi:Uncharacterised protein family (UPF0182)
VKPPARRWALVLGIGVLVVVLGGGRWLALEVAERAWATTIPGGAAYIGERDFARLISGVLLLTAVTWSTANLLFVYRSIGSMQLSHRLGDLEIVEAVPQNVLFASTIGCGLLCGFLLTLGTGDWWVHAALASHAPSFGVLDPVLHRDVGYYVARLPWTERLRAFSLLAVCAATIVVALLYVGIGPLRFRRWLPYANAHARAHLGLLLACLALILAWGALLDPVETVAGLHGSLTQRALDLRLPAAPIVAVFAFAAAGASLFWGLREKPVLLVSAWAALCVAELIGFIVIPGPLLPPGSRDSGAGVAAGGAPEGTLADTALASAQRRLESLALGTPALLEQPPRGFASAEAALAALPIWDASRVMVAAAARPELGGHATPVGAALAPPSLGIGAGRPTWIVAFQPMLDSGVTTGRPSDWTAVHRGPAARARPPVAAVEGDSALEFTAVPARDSTTWFGPNFEGFVVASPDTWPAVRRSAVALTPWWRRLALAWALQSPALARRETDGLVLMWRRNVLPRLRRLAPFATFDPPTPLVADSALWWVAYGYLNADGFPLARPVEIDGRWVRYSSAAFIAVVSAATGDTRLHLAPGADSVAHAWATLLTPMIHPLDSLAPALRAQLPFPRRTFRAAAALLERWRGDTTPWVPRDREPFELSAPPWDEPGVDGSHLWMGQGFEAGNAFAALVAGIMTPSAPKLFVWRPRAARLPPLLVGSPNTTAPGVMRVWSVAGGLFSEQARFVEPAGGTPLRGIDTVFLSWGDRRGQGGSPVAALRDLLAGTGGPRIPTDTSLAARWEHARRLARDASAALAGGDLAKFAQLYHELEQLLGVARRKLAPVPDRH